MELLEFYCVWNGIALTGYNIMKRGRACIDTPPLGRIHAAEHEPHESFDCFWFIHFA